MLWKQCRKKNVEKRKSILKTDIKDMKTKEQYQTSADKIHHIRLTAKLEQIIEGTATETIQNWRQKTGTIYRAAGQPQAAWHICEVEAQKQVGERGADTLQ